MKPRLFSHEENEAMRAVDRAYKALREAADAIKVAQAAAPHAGYGEALWWALDAYKSCGQAGLILLGQGDPKEDA